MTKTTKESACLCGRDCNLRKKVVVEYLYLDLNTCERCMGTDTMLDQVMQVLTPALTLAGFAVEYMKVEIKSAEIAKQYQFVSSPTIRVNGQDITNSVAENDCGCCSDISDADVACRVVEYQGETFEIPPKEMLAEGILRLVFGVQNESHTLDGYDFPDNLKKFFDGKKAKDSCSCKGGCC